MKASIVDPYAPRAREPWFTSLGISVVCHALAVLGIMGGSWFWGASVFKPVSPYTVSLVGAPLSLKQPSAAPTPKGATKPSQAPKALPKPSPKKSEVAPQAKVPQVKPVVKPANKPATKPVAKPVSPPQPPKPPPASKPIAKPKPLPPKSTPAKPKAVKPLSKPTKASSVAKAKSPSKTTVKPKPAAPPSATSAEAQSAVAALRKRQAAAALEQQQAVEAEQQAAQRIAALREQMAARSTAGPGAGAVAGLSQIRLSVYQERVRTEIIEAWILPLAPGQRRDLQATAFFRVLRDGQVEQLKLVQASGNSLFDTSLMRAIQSASPLPSLPADFAGEVLEVEMRFRAQDS